jgi:hypothetical protein
MKRITKKQVQDILLTLLIPGASFGIGILRKEGYTVKNSDFSRSVSPLPRRPSFPRISASG